MNRSRLSLNQYTVKQWSLREAIEGCARHGVPQIGVWRDKLAEQSLADTARQLRDAGVTVSSLCRGGFFSAPSDQERSARLDDNRRAIDECKAIDAPVLVLVCGPAHGQTLADARKTIADGIAELVPYAEERNVTLGVEPLHPMYAAERSAVVSMEQANDIAKRFQPRQVGVVVDVFHVWWDPVVGREIARCGEHICGFHVSDWLVPLPDMLLGRGVMGDGVIEISRLAGEVGRAGYNGIVEVEIFNQRLWDLDGEEAISQIVAAFERIDDDKQS